MTRVRTAILVVLALVLVGAWWRATRPDTLRVTAVFDQAVGLYAGDDVRVVGVPVGTVTSVKPDGAHIRVEMEIDPGTLLAADTGAVIVPPGILSSRYVQLEKPWVSGPKLADGTVIGASRTGTPLELDDVASQLDEFLAALGPNGLNKNGSLSRIVDSSARVLAGNGTDLRSTLADLAKALDTLGNSGGDIVSTIRNLQTFVSVLDDSDASIRSVEKGLAGVSAELAAQRGQLRSTIRSLGQASRAIDTFLRQDRGTLTSDVKDLAALSVTLKDRQRELTELIDLAPLGIENIIGAGNTRTSTTDSRLDLTPAFGSAPTALCNLLQQAALGNLCGKSAGSK